MTRTPADPVERRQPNDLHYDAERRRLSLGSCARSIAPDGGNPAVLETFVEVVAACRGTRPNHLVDVRDSDMDALSEALDLEATDLRQLLERVLGLSPALSTRLLSNLRQRRLLVRMASAAAGVAVVGGLATGLSAAPVAARASRRPPTSAPAAPQVAVDQPVVDGPLTVDENGVGLIPPVEVNADGTVLVPAVQVDRPADVDAAPAD